MRDYMNYIPNTYLEKIESAIQDEKERIIKLLEAEYERGGYEMGIVPHLIALIKGEK